MQVLCGLCSNSFRSYHLFSAAKGFHRIQNPSETVDHWFIPASDGKMYAIRSLEEEELVHFRQPKDYIGFYFDIVAYQTLESSTLVGKKPVWPKPIKKT
ncbi:hypothetical protein V6N11_053640 [Hibiscus sabdariffa]|uniref:Uncharacterized protein n=2 Tax=Hibiscus sabdariffa TaxID=183260 RepID=A0ABR2N797_9ROSI